MHQWPQMCQIIYTWLHSVANVELEQHVIFSIWSFRCFHRKYLNFLSTSKTFIHSGIAFSLRNLWNDVICFRHLYDVYIGRQQYKTRNLGVSTDEISFKKSYWVPPYDHAQHVLAVSPVWFRGPLLHVIFLVLFPVYCLSLPSVVKWKIGQNIILKKLFLCNKCWPLRWWQKI